jgi:protein involved in polysaccharide export with SLBB domain
MKIKFIIFVLTVFAGITAFSGLGISQTQVSDFGNIDFRTIKVDEISDDQIRQLIQKAEENGYSQQQIEAAAISKGMSQEEVQKLRLRMNTLQTGRGTQSMRTSSGLTRQEEQAQKRADLSPGDILTSMLTQPSDSLNRKEDPRTRIFGYSLFNTKDLTFEPSVNIPTPSKYILGPGDQLNIDIWGVSQQNYLLSISPDGYIVIDKVGPVLVSGLSAEEASKKIISRLSSIYSGLRPPNPNTFAQVSLGNLRSIKVILLGEVYLPGNYTLSSLSHAFNALYLSGGPDINGSLRNIQIIRDNRVIDSIDIYDFMFKGNIEKNILLHDQDIIKIEPYSKRVFMTGEVKRPMIYELKEGETIADAIKFSGGFSDKAYSSRIKIFRNTPREKEILDVPSSDFGFVQLENGDSVIVEKILDRYFNRVELRGAVYRPGNYSIQDTLTLLKLIEKAEGLRGDAFLSRAVIYRTRENYTLEAISVDLGAMLNHTTPDIPLKREDIVNIPSIFDLQEEFYIQIDGEVRNPGRYPFMYNSTVEDIIIQAGGLLESASMARLEVARRIKDAEATTASNRVAELVDYQISKDLQISEGVRKMILQPFDHIFVRRSPGYESQLTVMVEGEVLFPGEYSISNKNERISDMIKRAGGLTQDAYPRGASLLRTFPMDEKERTKTLQSTQILRNNYLSRNNAIMNANDQTSLINEIDYDLLDSIITSVTQLKNEQAIGISLENILQNPYSKYDLIVQGNDHIIIPKLLQTVSLSGGVLHPNNTRFDRKYSFRDYVRNAGGFTSDASRIRSYVIYANGSVDGTRSFLGIKNYPRLEPGAEIVVPLKRRRPVSLPEIAALGSAITSMALVIVTIFR